MREITQNAAYNEMVFMSDSADPLSGKTGLTLTITLSKNGGAFASVTPTVTERGNGWYSLAFTSSDTDTLGDFALHIEATGAEDTDTLSQVKPAVQDANTVEWNGTAVADLYSADIQFTRDQANTQDEYTVTWFKNGVRLTSGITSPSIQAVKRADGSSLITGTAMTQVGTTGTYKYDATGSQRQTVGEASLIIVSATIDSNTRSFSRLVGRDST
jgi:hypothetical protein